MEECWVLQPPRGQKSKSVVLFTGGAFAGAAPQLTYRLFIECLTTRGITVRFACSSLVRLGLMHSWRMKRIHQ